MEPAVISLNTHTLSVHVNEHTSKVFIISLEYKIYDSVSTGRHFLVVSCHIFSKVEPSCD